MSIRQSVKRCFPFIVPIYKYFKYGQWGSMDKWPEKALIKADMMYYKQTLEYKFDLNNPVTFTEKIQWYKFFYEHPDINRITDKVRFKEYIKEKLGEGYTIPIYGAWDNVCSLEEEWNKKDGALPEQFVLKANLQSDDNGIKFIHEKNKVAFDSIKHEMESWLEIKTH